MRSSSRYIPLALLLFFLVSTTTSAQGDKSPKAPPSLAEKTAGLTAYDGFFNFFWSEQEGKIYLQIDRWEEEFLYVNSLAAGLGSNDIGLDRNQLGENRVVRFRKVGPKVLLLERNLNYRADSANPDERQSVEDAFAQSILGGFAVEATTGNSVLIDLTPLLMEDAHGVIRRLKANNEGVYKIDPKRSVIHLDRTRNFPDNSEFEALLAFSGEPSGRNLRSVTATATDFSLRQHHSFIRLPDEQYQARVYDPRSGYFQHSYADYASPIGEPLEKRFIRRHRLEKKDPTAAISEPVKPIIYYLDRGAPEPIRSALLEGAQWWNQAFEAAGYSNAFQVQLLPEEVDPMDVRYNLINWVHRSTRGWSYGSSVIDPRTGEILKGHVLLGSLRVRQDFLIAQGLVDAYTDGSTPDPRMLEMALARLRQLSAHEVGHTIGLAHNFAASVNDRASVMDYPHPYTLAEKSGTLDFSNAYATGIGEWDKRAILYGYQHFPPSINEMAALKGILAETEAMGLHYVSDPDARPINSANALGHLWDNGEDPIKEMGRLQLIRKRRIAAFGIQNIPTGAPLSSLENVFVPLYLMHRYQTEAVSKLIGGYYYDYAVREEGPQKVIREVEAERQISALTVLLRTLHPEFLMVPATVKELLLPQAYGYQRDRELFPFYTGATFDPIGAATVVAEHTLSHLLHPDRLARVSVQENADKDLLEKISIQLTKQMKSSNGEELLIAEAVFYRYTQHLFTLAAHEKAAPWVRSRALQELELLPNKLQLFTPSALLFRNHMQQFRERPADFKPVAAPKIPDGAPIGCGNSSLLYHTH